MQDAPSVPHVLDNPVWSALTGPHAHLAGGTGAARRYPREVSPFFAFGASGGEAYRDMAALLGPGEVAPLFRGVAEVPRPGWEQVVHRTITQMVCTSSAGLAAPEPSIVPLTQDDVPEMLALVALTRPGPFGPRTLSLGRYVGVREGGRLVAMAGERLHPEGYVEISAVCTHPDHRGRGLARALTSEVAWGIFSRGLTPFLHVMPDNVGAIRVYGALGFTVRADVWLTVLRPPLA